MWDAAKPGNRRTFILSLLVKKQSVKSETSGSTLRNCKNNNNNNNKQTQSNQKKEIINTKVRTNEIRNKAKQNKIPYICISILYWSLSFWLTSLCIMGSSTKQKTGESITHFIVSGQDHPISN